MSELLRNLVAAKIETYKAVRPNLVPVVTISNRMAFMQMKRLGDERARRRGFENVFDRFDKNKNGKRHYDLSNFIIIAYCPRFDVCKRFFERAGQVEH